MARTTPACQSDLACFRNDGHPGECMYPTSSGHVHKGEWCEACVQHGVTLAATPAPLDADRLARALTEVQGGALDSWMGRAPLIAAAYAEEPHGG